MDLIMLKAKLHQARVTHAVPNYEGSCAISGDLLDLAGILEYEQIYIYNVTNGERFITYAIRGEDLAGIISVSDAAALKVNVGDRLIICAYAALSSTELAGFKPTMVYMKADNSVSHTANAIPVPLAE
ncbi:aspartate 1-decarboxylase [Reinekea sp.]|uniref:aspartate 1-decarboxylase n=1 Tax=Reinekea sp. TaxID=1970455 RepID=UPI002A837BFC|nr:aspartate 1-decarboxylase [Reinekea sp.]